MKPVVTLTLSPSLDIATQVPRLYPDAKLRCEQPRYAPGGGGINVARAIHILGGSALALYPAGGSTGLHLSALLDDSGVPHQAIPIAQWTRESLNLTEQASAQQYRLIMPGARLSEAEQGQVLDRLQALAQFDYLVISGSLPEGLAEDFMPRLLAIAQARGVHCIVDCSGAGLLQVLEIGGVFLLKPNIDELSAAVGEEISEPNHLLHICQGLIAAGKCQALLVSLGPQGALLVSAEQSASIAAPAVRKRSTVGAGDSMVAALTIQLAAGADLLSAARFAVAAGSAAIMTEGSELCRREDAERLYAWMQR
jgi:6-phosphofructokinase 2